MLYADCVVYLSSAKDETMCIVLVAGKLKPKLNCVLAGHSPCVVGHCF